MTSTLAPLRFRKVLLKVSGEVLMGDTPYGIDMITVARVAADIAEMMRLGVQVCLVIGGGNIFRGLSGAAKGMDRTSADYMGMLATVMNALASRTPWSSTGWTPACSPPSPWPPSANPTSAVARCGTWRRGGW